MKRQFVRLLLVAALGAGAWTTGAGAAQAAVTTSGAAAIGCNDHLSGYFTVYGLPVDSPVSAEYAGHTANGQSDRSGMATIDFDSLSGGVQAGDEIAYSLTSGGQTLAASAVVVQDICQGTGSVTVTRDCTQPDTLVAEVTLNGTVYVGSVTMVVSGDALDHATPSTTGTPELSTDVTPDTNGSGRTTRELSSPAVALRTGTGTATFESYWYHGATVVPDTPVVVPPCRTYYKKAFAPTIWLQEEGAPLRAVSYAEWEAAGFPAPRPTPTDYVKYPWSPVTYAVTYWGADESTWAWDELGYSQWQAAGSPVPRSAGWIAGSYFYKWGTSGELFVVSAYNEHHKLTYDEWKASGFRPYVDRGNEGFLLRSWAPTVVRMTDLAGGQGTAIYGAEWKAEAQPTPRVVQRIPGDHFFQHRGSAAVYYEGPATGLGRPLQHPQLTYDQWVAAGRPVPEIR